MDSFTSLSRTGRTDIGNGDNIIEPCPNSDTLIYMFPTAKHTKGAEETYLIDCQYHYSINVSRWQIIMDVNVMACNCRHWILVSSIYRSYRIYSKLERAYHKICKVCRQVNFLQRNCYFPWNQANTFLQVGLNQ